MTRAGTHHDIRKRLDLTGRQREVIELLARGYTNGQIGDALGISLDGAKWHVSEIIGKFEVSSREEAVDYWRAYTSTGARMSRVLNSLAAAGILKWAAGGAAALAVAGGVAVAIAIATGGSDPGAAAAIDPTATRTATVTATRAGVIVETPASNSTPSAEPSATSTVTTEATPGPGEARTPLQIFFMRGEHVAAVYREVPQTISVGAAVVEQLLAGPSAADADTGLTSAIPAGVSLLGLNIAGGVATVDLSGEFESGGGSLSMQARLAQLVYTLTQFPTVDSVVFHIDGEPAATFGGEGIVLDGPVDRADFEDITPAILLESPAQWETVAGSSVRLKGTANTFEATFQVNVVDNSGVVIAESTVTATSGTGTRGIFDVVIPFELTREGLGAIVAFEASAQDGSPINVVEIPVYFER